ncbi:hypothetical protein FCV25MIE_15296 [Fagus crenata]
MHASKEKPVRCIKVKVAGRSNVPWWGKPAYGENPVAPVTHANADHGSDQVNVSVLVNEDIQDPLPPSRKTGEDFESELREIDEALNSSPPNLEVTNKARGLTSVPITWELRESNKKENPNLVGDVVDKEIEELRNRVVLQDILGRWKRLPREKDSGTVEAVVMPLLGAKRGGNWIDGQNASTSGKKKGRGAVAMEGVEVVGGSAEAVQQPRRTQ